MDGEKLDIFGEDVTDAPLAVETPPEVPTEAPAPAPETGEPLAAPPAAESKVEHSAPLTALLDEREKRQKAEREAEDLRRWKAEREAREREAAEKAPKPDFFEDPEAAVQRQVTAVRLGQSRFFAEREFGAETIAQVNAWLDTLPDTGSQFLRHPSPWHAAAEAYRRHKSLSVIGDDPEKWIAAERERIRAELLKEAPSSAPTPPPASMASAPSAGRHEPIAVKAPPNLVGLFNG